MDLSRLSISFSDIKSVQSISDDEHSLSANDVIIYTIYLPNFINLTSDLAEFLNPKELIKAHRFYKEIDTTRFIIYRSILKLILASHTKKDVKNIYLDYHLNKKPYLASFPRLHFNMSHSEDFAVIAISRRNVGIDIEYMSEDFNFSNLLPDVFEDHETLTIQNAENKKHAFYTAWTRKEAFVKALGKGIDEDFKHIPCLDGKHTIDSTLLNSTENWQVYSFDLADHYLGAVAIATRSKSASNLGLYSIPNTLKSLLALAPF